jgi:hypothetical protein
MAHELFYELLGATHKTRTRFSCVSSLPIDGSVAIPAASNKMSDKGNRYFREGEAETFPGSNTQFLKILVYFSVANRNAMYGTGDSSLWGE